MSESRKKREQCGLNVSADEGGWGAEVAETGTVIVAYEGELPQLIKARDDAYNRRDPATGQRLNGEIGKRKDDAGRTLDQCIRDKDEAFKAAMRKAKEACK